MSDTNNTAHAVNLDSTNNAPAKAPAKRAPAKAAPAKAAAKAPRKAAVRSDAPKLRWTAVGDADAKTGPIIAVTDDTTFEVVPSGDKWKATARKGKKVTVIADQVGRVKAYQVAVRFHQTGELPAKAS